MSLSVCNFSLFICAPDVRLTLPSLCVHMRGFGFNTLTTHASVSSPKTPRIVRRKTLTTGRENSGGSDLR